MSQYAEHVKCTFLLQQHIASLKLWSSEEFGWELEMIIREERDLGCVSISSTQVSGAVVLSEGWLGRFSYPLCYLPSCSSQGLEGRGDPHF